MTDAMSTPEHGCLNAMTDGHQHQANTFTVVSTDETNAYGRAFRSVCLLGARMYAPGIAGLVAAEWQTGASIHGKGQKVLGGRIGHVEADGKAAS